MIMMRSIIFLFLLSCLISINAQISYDHRGRIPEQGISSMELRNQLKDLQILRKELESQRQDTTEISESIQKTVRFLYDCDVRACLLSQPLALQL